MFVNVITKSSCINNNNYPVIAVVFSNNEVNRSECEDVIKWQFDEDELTWEFDSITQRWDVSNQDYVICHVSVHEVISTG